MNSGAMWRDTGRRVGFFGLDAWCVAPLALWALHWRWWTFYAAVAGVVFFGVLQRFGMTVPASIRWLRSAVAGRDRSGTPWAKRAYYG